jgi:hypothetical protein
MTKLILLALPLLALLLSAASPIGILPEGYKWSDCVTFYDATIATANEDRPVTSATNPATPPPEEATTVEGDKSQLKSGLPNAANWRTVCHR